MRSLTRIFRKCTTAPVWWFERHRPYPLVRKPHLLLPRLEDPGTPADAPVLVVLSTPQTLWDAIWAGWSWYRFLAGEVCLWLCCDGDLPSAASTAAAALLPAAKLTTMEGLLSQLGPAPIALKALATHPLSRKLQLIFNLQVQRSLLYVDSDVLAINEPVELRTYLHSDTPVYLKESNRITTSPVLQARSDLLGLGHDPRLNSGLLYIPRQKLDSSILERLFDGWVPPENDWFIEQWALAVAFHQAGGVALPPQRYVVSNARQFWHFPDVEYDKIACRHFVTPVRHVMYLKGLPYLAKSSRGTLPLSR